jgi:N-acyl-L-homoserine lactone synthetase
LIAATATNKQSTEKLDELLADVANALPGYARMLPTGAPYNLQTNNAEYLAVNVPLELEITI